jgi:hypothetical protein
MTRGLSRRLSRVGSALVPRKQYRIAMRYEGPASERFTQPSEQDIREANIVLNIRSVRTLDERSESASAITEDAT